VILKNYISQDSVAARCRGIFSDHFITNFPQKSLVKKNVNVGQYLATVQISGLHFWAILYIYQIYYTDDNQHIRPTLPSFYCG